MPTLTERAEAFRQHLIAFMARDGLITSEINVEGPRAITKDDFERYETCDYAADDFTGLMTTGRFVHAEVLRHLRTVTARICHDN